MFWVNKYSPTFSAADLDQGSSAFYPFILDQDPGKHPGSYFRKLILKIFVLKILKLFAADPDSGAGSFFTLDSGSGMEK